MVTWKISVERNTIDFEGKFSCSNEETKKIPFFAASPKWNISRGNYGKSPFLLGKSTISMAIFNSYNWANRAQKCSEQFYTPEKWRLVGTWKDGIFALSSQPWPSDRGKLEPAFITRRYSRGVVQILGWSYLLVIYNIAIDNHWKIAGKSS